MKIRFIPAFVILSILATGRGSAQQPEPNLHSGSAAAAPFMNYSHSLHKPLTVSQQRARFEAEQRLYRAEWNNWIGYSPLRPSLNSSYMSNIAPRYFVPSRGILIRTGQPLWWYW